MSKAGLSAHAASSTESPAAADGRPRPAGVSFRVEAVDGRTAARAGVLSTPHGEVPTPVFMAVATQGCVKLLTPEQVASAGTRMILANAYHLALRPGAQVVRALGGIHRMSGWGGPMLTDSGGYQIYSLAGLRSVDDDGVTFQSHIDGRTLRLTPADCVRIQEEIGADVIMALDECLPYPVERLRAEDSLRRTLRWARVCRDSRSRGDQALFGIVQGATYRDLRIECAGALAEMKLDGYAIGGLSVGEGRELSREVLSYTVGALPEDRPRYLMGVGPPEDILDAVALGVDMFDCVLPTRNARSGWAFTRDGVLRLRNSRWRSDNRPISSECRCYACGKFSRGMLRHLLCSGEATGGALVTIHNLTFYADMMAGIRDAVASGEFLCYAEDFRARIIGRSD